MVASVALLLDDHGELQRSSGVSDRRTSRSQTRGTGTAADRASLQEHGSSWQVFMFDSFMLMFGGTQLGYAMGQMGWVWGSFWLAFSVISTYISGHLLGLLVRETGAGSYPELGEAIFGRGAAVLVEIFQWSGYYLTGVVQIAFTGAAWDQTFRNWAWARPICTDQWMLITTAVLLPLMQVPSFTQFGKLALLASIVTLYATGVYLGQILDKGQYRAGHGAVPGVSIPCYDQWTSASMLASISNMAFTFSGHGTFPEQIRELRNPGEFHYAFNVLYALAVPFYAGCAVLAFWAFGNMNSANNVENLADDAWQSAAMYAGLVTGFLNIVLGQVVLMLKVELPLGVLPCDWWASTSEAHLDSRAAAALRRWRVPPVVFRVVFRTLYLGSLLLLAEALVGAGLAIYVNIAGCLGLAAMTYWLPYVLWLAREYQARRAPPRATPEEEGGRPQHAGDDAPSAWERLRLPVLASVCVVNALGGVFISASGLYFSVAQLGDEDVHLFRERSCKEGAHFWGDQMWDAALPPNASAYTTLVVGCCANGTSCGA